MLRTIMIHHWLIITFSWLGSVRLQYINTGGPSDLILEPMDSRFQYPYPYVNYVNLPETRNDFETAQNEPENFYPPHEQVRKRRYIRDDKKDNQMVPNLIESRKTLYLSSENEQPFIFNAVDENGTNYLEQIQKRYFSPWGGKRSDSSENSWTWKRGNNLREPSMPKRVRFSPWGGKRSGQTIFRPSSNGFKVIFASNIPNLTKIVSNYSPQGSDILNLAGFQVIPTNDKRHPIKIVAVSSRIEDKTRDALPYKTFLETLPKMFKHGHPYLDVNLKKDGKRKVKFSAWGGKRSPPIIGPIWTPTDAETKESTLNTVLLIRKSQDNGQATSALY